MSVTLTENATNRVRQVMEKSGSGKGIRIGVKDAGCSGLTYVVGLAEEIGPDDQVFEQNGVTVVIKGDDLPFLAGIELDYRRQGINEAFSFNNPNAKETCGCGESFTV